MEQIIDLTLLIAGFTIVGVFTSTLIEILQENLSKNKTKLLTIFICLLVGGLITWLYNSAYLQTVLWVLGSASTFYAFIFKDSKNV